jgi:glutathione synthase/RimK-type ligase-like ATP-grasp enzyme
MSADRPLLLIFGGGDEADRIRRSGQHITIAGSADLGKLLPNREMLHRLLITRDHQPRREEVSGYPVIVNLITEPENSARILASLKQLLRGVPARVINPPDAVLRSTRDQVAELLAGIDGLIAPKTVRLRGDAPDMAARTLAGAGVELPIILRQAGTHGGKIVGVFDSIEQAIDALESGRDHIATRFVDFRSEDGLYRKFRVFFIGNRRILRHMLIYDNWIVHGHARYEFMVPRPELIAEERAMFENDSPFAPRVEAVFDAVRSRMPLDFFGMDFALTRDGQVLLFEANATMSFMPNLFVPQFEYLQRCVAPAQAALMELLGLGA